MNEKTKEDYIKKVDPKIKEYFHMIEPEIPEWLNDYINTKEMLKQQYISVTCGTIYSKLFASDFFFSSLDHSIAVALIIWHFTHDKIQTLSGLFHDIATPAFKHCVDFLNGDYMTQESTEDLTTEIIKNSTEIMSLLKRDGIKLSQVDNYHMYPIADNDTPQLSSDRLEYSLSNGIFIYKYIDIAKAKEIFQDIEVEYNEDKIEELGFKTKKIARDFVRLTSKLSIGYREEKTRFSMQFIADILKGLNEKNKISKADLYKLKEKDVIDIIEKSEYGPIFKIWRNSKKINISDQKPENVYYVNHGAKVRYINPLCKGERMSSICKIADNLIKKNLAYDMNKYIYLNFEFPRDDAK